MAQPIKDYSAERVGKTWMPEDHTYLCRVLDRIESTAEGMVRNLDKALKRDAIAMAQEQRP